MIEQQQKKITVFPSYIFINVRQNKGDSPVSVSWSIRVSWFKMKLLLAESQLLTWANKPCKDSGYSCSPDYSLFHCTELKAVLLTKIFCYCICIASNWFLSSAWFILIFFFFGLLIGSANHLHCRKSRLAPLTLYPPTNSAEHKEMHRTQGDAPSSHIARLDIDYIYMSIFYYVQTMTVYTSLKRQRLKSE